LSKVLSNQNFWGCSCNPSSYTTIAKYWEWRSATRL